MAGHFQHLAALFAEAQPETAVGEEDVLHVHSERRGDSREAVRHGCDQGAVAKTSDGLHRDGPQETAALGGGKNRCRPAANSVLRTAYGSGRRRRYHLTDSQPVEEPSDPGQFLLDRRARKPPANCYSPHLPQGAPLPDSTRNVLVP